MKKIYRKIKLYIRGLFYKVQNKQEVLIDLDHARSIKVRVLDEKSGKWYGERIISDYFDLKRNESFLKELFPNKNVQIVEFKESPILYFANLPCNSSNILEFPVRGHRLLSIEAYIHLNGKDGTKYRFAAIASSEEDLINKTSRIASQFFGVPRKNVKFAKKSLLHEDIRALFYMNSPYELKADELKFKKESNF